ncbi:MAG: aspartate--tRNA ligase [Candidatus Magasanikbacteria bacterium]|jgi:aspartyl-tRNA synthetase|nr:aspartate--tRNA ligase [Candidatus Magasanikbacteria bacterium]MBT4314633.1 aspartate--tRNA ligase [Candidatus Magasanikbacteria bacterium]MBT4547054.1 aspartate--tRNA ligase [Candidatus Magasanikbacteria bacterium]MBT6819514.1 aspartate--tRNA ligase [Candidatus Magasanikbacteria bacterium]
MYRTHKCGELSKKDAGKEVTLSGWVHKRRDLGGLIFVDLRDRYGLTQIVFNPDEVVGFDLAEKLKYEFVIKVTGLVEKRDKKNINKDLSTGEIEIHATGLEILSTAKAMPFEIFETKKGDEDEELRLKYRYLELRREKLRNNILFRAKVVKYIRDYMEARDFIDIATPVLTVSSPEGARDFLVPSRVHPGKFYALPQAPQQYKQLLMVAGFDRYYQIAACMRDEDARADRSPGEFYQLDLETSFLTQEEFFEEIEPLFIELTEKVSDKKVMQKPFPRIPFKTAMEEYGSDRPDLRFDLKLQDISDWAGGTDFKVFSSSEFVRALVIPGGEKFTRKEIDEFEDRAKRHGAKGLAWMKYEGGKFDGGVSKFFDEEKLSELSKLAGVTKDCILFFVADKWETSCLALGAVRTLVGEKFELSDPNTIGWAWIVDFPMYEKDEESGKIDFSHNPFSLPQGGMEALENENPLDILGYQYDIIANGLELSSGAVRNKDPKIMYKAFEIAGYTKEQVDEKFGHMIDAFEYGAPPHCGIAPGIERLVMVLLGEKNIRTVVPFPKNQKAEEPMMGSPAYVDDSQLKELGISIIKKDGGNK